MKRLLLLLAAVLAFIAGPAAAQTFPKLTGRVVDNAHLLSPQQAAALDGKLAALEAQSQRQMVVVTLPTLDGYEIEDYGYRLGRAWGIGDKQRNDGLLLIVAPTERKVRIEAGYGLEGIITDALSSVIISREIVPRFKTGDYAGGISAASDQLIAQLQLPEDEARKVAQAAKKPKGPKFDAGTIIFLLIFFFFFVLPFIRSLGSNGRSGGRRHGGMPGVMIFPTGGWGGGSDWGGGGGGSDWGGGGGFGGGGGSFGGGGSSGSW